MHSVHQLKVECRRVLDLTGPDILQSLGVNLDTYKSLDYSVTTRISAAANFMEFEAMLVPTARFTCKNLVIFAERCNHISIVESEPVNWDLWRGK